MEQSTRTTWSSAGLFTLIVLMLAGLLASVAWQGPDTLVYLVLYGSSCGAMLAALRPDRPVRSLLSWLAIAAATWALRALAVRSSWHAWLAAAIAMLAFASVFQLRSRGRAAATRPIVRRSIATALVALGLIAALGVIIVAGALVMPAFIEYVERAAPAGVECAYRLALEYNTSSRRFEGTMHAEAWERTAPTLVSPAPDPRHERTRQQLESLFEGFPASTSPVITHDGERVRVIAQRIPDVALSESWLTTTRRFEIPHILRRSCDSEVEIRAPEHVILRHNLEGAAEARSIDDQDRNIVVISKRGSLAADPIVRYSKPLAQNALFGGLAGRTLGDVLEAAFWYVLAGLSYLAAVAGDVVKDARIKPLATAMLAKLGVIKSVGADAASPSAPP